MPNPDAAPQTPGNVRIDLTPNRERVEIDGYRLEQHMTGLRLTFDAQKRKPVLLIELAPSALELTATGVELKGEFRDFLLSRGWQPPN